MKIVASFANGEMTVGLIPEGDGEAKFLELFCEVNTCKTQAHKSTQTGWDRGVSTIYRLDLALQKKDFEDLKPLVRQLGEALIRAQAIINTFPTGVTAEQRDRYEEVRVSLETYTIWAAKGGA